MLRAPPASAGSMKPARPLRKKNIKIEVTSTSLSLSMTAIHALLAMTAVHVASAMNRQFCIARGDIVVMKATIPTTMPAMWNGAVLAKLSGYSIRSSSVYPS